MKKPVIVLGVTGGIAAYKAAALCSHLVQSGYEVPVIMTANSQKFITELTFRTLSRRPVLTDLFAEPQWRPAHVALAEEADFLLVAPATANFIAKYAHGIADDALTTFAAAFPGPVGIAPAMNPEMWKHPACQDNISCLQRRGVHLIGPASGRVACGTCGTGRMSEPDEILAVIKKLLPCPQN